MDGSYAGIIGVICIISPTYKIVLALKEGNGIFALVGMTTGSAYVAIAQLNADKSLTSLLLKTNLGAGWRFLTIAEISLGKLVMGGDCSNICIWDYNAIPFTILYTILNHIYIYIYIKILSQKKYIFLLRLYHIYIYILIFLTMFGNSYYTIY